MSGRPLVGISSCLLGQEVRHDGRHKRQAELMKAFDGVVEWVPVCPEFELGMGVPREPIRLEETAGAVRLVSVETRRDHTDAFAAWVERRFERLERLSGYVFKARSPSCGVGSTSVFTAEGVELRKESGMFAAAFADRFPDVPLAEEEDLASAAGREHFRIRVRARSQLYALFARGWRPAELVRFHTRYKLLLLAHSPAGYAELGRLVAYQKERKRERVKGEYTLGLVRALSVEPTLGGHVNALQHAAGYFSGDLAPEERQSLSDHIEEIRRDPERLPEAKRRILDYARRFGQTYLEEQAYFQDAR